VKRNNKALFATDVPVEVRHVVFDAGRVSGEIRAARAGRLWIGIGAPRAFPQGVSKIG